MNRLDLIDAMRLAKSALSNQDYLPILKHFVFDGESLSAYNDSLGISIDFESDLKCAIPGDLLQSLVTKYSAEELKFDVGEEKIEMKCGRNRTSLPYLPLEDAIDWIPNTDPLTDFKADGAFLMGLDRCKEFVGDDANRLAEIGVTITAKADGSGDLFATDNLTMSRQHLNLKNFEGDELNCIIPVAWCNTVINLTNEIGDEDVHIEFGEGYVMADIGEGEAIVVAKLIEAEPYNFEEIIDQNLEGVEYEKSLVSPPVEFYAALERNLVIQSVSQDKEVDISLSGSVMKMNCNSAIGDSDDDITFETKFNDIDFKCDPQLLTKAGKICSKLAFLQNVVVAKEGPFIHLISHNASDEG